MANQSEQNHEVLAWLNLHHPQLDPADIVWVSGFFNILHPGHLRLLRFAAECGKLLVVGVLANENSEDPKFFDEQTRLECVQAIDWVDYAFVLRALPEAIIQILRPGVVVKGKEHETLNNPEQAVVDAYSGKLIFSSGESHFSTADLINNARDSSLSLQLPQDFIQRHALKQDELKELFQRLAGLKVCVIGDTIVDEYVQCDPVGMSQEDPTLVVTPIDRQRFLGGAAIVAGHIKSLGAGEVHYFSVLGKDEVADFARQGSQRYNIVGHFEVDESRPTSLKQRFRARNKTLLRVNQLRQHQIGRQFQDSLYQRITELAADADLIIFSDFNYGVLPQTLLERLVSFCQQRGIVMVADSQCSSQLGDISRFKNMNFICPTEYEARIALRDNDVGLVTLAESLRQRAQAEHVFITLGEEGMLIHAAGDEHAQFYTDRLPAFNTAPQDNAGAGDSFMAMAALAMTAGANVWQCAYLGSLASACQVARIGNRPIQASELMCELNRASTQSQQT